MDTGDTAWMLTASALVLLMTPGAGVLLRRTGPRKKRSQHHYVQLHGYGGRERSLSALGLSPSLWRWQRLHWRPECYWRVWAGRCPGGSSPDLGRNVPNPNGPHERSGRCHGGGRRTCSDHARRRFCRRHGSPRHRFWRGHSLLWSYPASLENRHRRCLGRTSCSRCWRGLGRTSHPEFSPWRPSAVRQER